MKKHLLIYLVSICPLFVFSQNVGIGTSSPAAKLTIDGSYSSPLIPGVTSNGILRIGPNQFDALDIGKTGFFPYAAWLQSGAFGNADPISLQPLGGNVGIGTMFPKARLEVTEIGAGSAIPSLRVYQSNCGPVCGQTTGISLQLINNNETSVSNGARISFAENANVLAQDEGAATINLVARDVTNGRGGLAISTRSSSGFFERMRIDTVGNVGIGLLSPSELLHVNGNVKVAGIISGVSDPVSAQDAATKAYVDAGPTYTIGLWPELGGYVFWVSADGKHGLVAETIDQTTNSNYYNAQDITSNPGNHSANGNKFRDWRLPTKHELNEMYLQKINIGGFLNEAYWSSTESDNEKVWAQGFSSGSHNATLKTTANFNVRSVREF